jgi:hypothetical protein
MRKRSAGIGRAAAMAAFALVAFSAATALGATCSPAPAAGCKLPIKAGKSSLQYKQTGLTDPDDIYTWRWNVGSHTDIADFGYPLATTGYALCIYDSSGRPQPVVGNPAAAGPGWSSVKNGWLYDYRPSRPLRRMVMKAGPDGKAHILVHGDSDTLTQLLPFVAPVVVQLQNDAGTCWATTLTNPTHSDDGSFRAKDQ